MAFKLKYKNSAFPFKGSPVKELQTESGESVVEVDNEGSEVEQENIETAKKVVYGPGMRGFKRPESKTPKWTGFMSV